MVYNREAGKKLAVKHLSGFSSEYMMMKLQHSFDVGEFAYKVAARIKKMHPACHVDAELAGFLGYVHDIGRARNNHLHELHTIDMLVEEGIDRDIARMAMHSQLLEQYGEKEGDVQKYLPVGIEGMILTYADMVVKTGSPISIDERVADVAERTRKSRQMNPELIREILESLPRAVRRFKRYERIVFLLAGVGSAKEFI
ncbi:MAG TPA: HD domain-containing protein [Nanoarchaeota archaeon]|nr:HD domain-containing protein [Nanoarchaeota archaeon]